MGATRRERAQGSDKARSVIGANGLPDIWTGPGSLHTDAPAAVDPWYKLPIREILGCYSGTFDAVLGHGRILKEL